RPGGGRPEHLSGRIGARQPHFLAFVIHDLHQRTDVLTRGRTILRIHHLNTGQARQLVSLGVNGNPFFNAHKGHEAGHLGDDRVSVWVPLGHDLTSLNLITGLDAQLSTVGQLVPLTLTTMAVGNGQRGRTGHHHQVAVRLLNGLQVVQTDGATVFHVNAVHRGSPGGRTTDVERTHRQLGTGLTDRLSGDNTDGLTHVHQVATGQVAAVALGAHTMAGFTGNGGAYDDLVHTGLLNQLYQRLVQQGTGRQQHALVITRGEDVTGGYPTQYAVTQGHNNVTTFNQRCNQDALIGTTVDL